MYTYLPSIRAHNIYIYQLDTYNQYNAQNRELTLARSANQAAHASEYFKSKYCFAIITHSHTQHKYYQ